MRFVPSPLRLVLSTVCPALLLCATSVSLCGAPSSEPQALRSGTLDDLFVLRDYRPGKNSFVESPERHIGTWTNQGFRYTLADLKGQGSLRHIWTTRGDGPPYFDWEFYVDDETTPCVRGTDEELVEAASRFSVPVAPANWLPVHNCAFNFYEAELGGMGHAFLARRYLESDRQQTVRCLFAHDDPVEVLVNGQRIYEGAQRFNGFESTWINLPLRQGRNEIVVRLTHYFNRNFNWTGFLFRPEMGK